MSLTLVGSSRPSHAPVTQPVLTEELERVLVLLRAGRAAEVDAGALRGARLAGHDLTGLQLNGWDLRGADLSHATLSEARLGTCDLRGALLVEARLDHAELIHCDLREADLSGCSGEQVNLGHSDLSEATLFSVDLNGGRLNGATLRGTDLRNADLEGARIRDADLTGADCTRAKLRGVDLGRSDVSGASFHNCDLRQARLRGIKGYKSATWIGVDMHEVDFTGAYLLRRHVIDENYLFEFRNQGRLARFIYAVWWATSDCGRSLGRWGLWNLLFALVFAGIYHTVELDYGAHRTVWSPLYFSSVTMTTLGYGDVQPASAAAQGVAVVQVLLGYVGLGGLLSIFANKMARRGD